MSICVLVADSSKAKILVAESGQDPLVEKEVLDHPEGRLREQDLVTDGSGGEGYEGEARQHQAAGFAAEICTELDRLRRTSELHRIYLVAPPKFLGLLRSALSQQCSEMLAGEINKDLVNHKIDDIRSQLPKRM